MTDEPSREPRDDTSSPASTPPAHPPSGQPQPAPGDYPPQPYGPQHYPPPQPFPPSPKKSNRTAWMIVLIVVGSLFALCCAGGGVIGFFVYKAAREVTPAANATRAFIDDLRSGDSSDAYNRLCATTKGSFPQAVFNSIVESEPQITSYKIVDRNVDNINGVQTARVVADLNRASGAIDRHTFLLRRERGKWLVCGQPY